MRRIAFGVGFLLLGVTAFAIVAASRISVKEPRTFGVTFAPFHAENFGLDAKETYRAILDDLGVREIRISAYWNRIEREPDVFDFSELDWQVREAEARGAELILAVGQKVPRWPECHIPEWARALPREHYREELLRYIVRVVERYTPSPAVKIWQVENEPFLDFGICPEFDRELLDAEIAEVRKLDSRPVMVTDSGELSTWISAHRRADIFGSTLYRTVWSLRFGAITYPLPPSFFRVKRAIAEWANGMKPAVIIELQAEPWQEKALYDTEPLMQYETMNPKKFRATLRYIRGTGFDEFYFWGAEWWYWLKEKQGMPEIWNTAKAAIANVRTQDSSGF